MTSLPIALVLLLFSLHHSTHAEPLIENDLYSETSEALLNDPIVFESQEQKSDGIAGNTLPLDEQSNEEEVAIVSEFEQKDDDNAHEVEQSLAVQQGPKIINAIYVVGNTSVPVEAIINKIPYHVGEPFSSLKTKTALTNVFDMGFFKGVDLKAKVNPNNTLDLYFMVEEKKLLKDVLFKGNKSLTEKDIKKKINFSEKPALDESDLKKYIIALKKLYREKDYHHADVQAHLVPDETTDKVNVIFEITENKKTQIQRVFFEGNKTFTDKQLRSLLFTREEWILGFMDRAGSYQPEAIEADRHSLENFYQSYGFLNAKVTDVNVEKDTQDPTILRVTFHINEGDLYTISDIKIPGNDVVSEKELKERIPIKVGNLYSKDKIRESIEVLRTLLGEHGYIYADVDVAPEPNDDNKTVSLSFFIELGDRITLRKIQIRGNEKTRQKIIRRQLLFDEGDLLTTQKLESSRNQIEKLGYFDQQNGVSWKIRRVSKDIADLELFVREVKTGRVDMQLGFGGSPKDLQNPTESLRVGGSISDTNLLGLGIGFNLSGEFSKQERQLLFNITEPWLFDRPIFAAFDIAIKKSIYEDFQFTKEEVKEQLVNGSFSLGFVAQKLNQTKFVGMFGVEGLHYNNPPEVNTSSIPDPKEAAEYAQVLRRRFPHGSFVWTAVQASQDFRNHPLHPSRGYQWLGQTRIALPSNGQFNIATSPNASPFNFGFWKVDFDASYYTPLIGERDLVFYFHTHFGTVNNFAGKVIPFRELYHIGGPASVRGFLFGEIGPTFKGVDSLGAKKAFWLNTELIFPVAPDFSIKGVLFYDGGAGWDTPDASVVTQKRLLNNHFNYRHSVGFGVRLLRPTPVKIDWGFKLDRKKGEKASQVHLSMSHDF